MSIVCLSFELSFKKKQLALKIVLMIF